MPKQRKDTRISLHPLTLDEAVKRVVRRSKRGDSQDGETGSTSQADHEAEQQDQRNGNRRKPAAD